MKLFKTTHFRILGMFVLFAGLTLTSCKDSSTSVVEEEDIASLSEKMGVMNNAGTSNVYFSDENVLTYDHINATTVDDWTTSVCKDDGSGSIGLNDPRWTRTDGQTASNIRPLLSGGLHAFETWWSGTHHPTNFGQADWINSVYKRYSTQMNPDGDGHNWTRYELPVDGNGKFELKLLADNCSWIYLDDKLVGYQDDSGLNDVNNTRYGVTLDGPATLTYIIYDGGGDAGGKFRLETTTEDIPEFEDPTEPTEPENSAPVADAGADQTIEATGSTTSVTLDGTGSSDPDGDTLTYSWNNDDADATTTVELGVGIHTFTLTVSDGQGGSDSDEVVVEITDTTAPELSFSQETNSLWPPNHKMVLVASGISASDIVDGATDVTVAITSNEASNGRGDGNTNSDYEIVTNSDGSQDVYVRSERSGKKQGRTYTITMSTSDVAGNSASESIEVEVAKSQGRR